MSKNSRYENLLHFTGMYQGAQVYRTHLKNIEIDRIRGTRKAVNVEKSYNSLIRL